MKKRVLSMLMVMIMMVSLLSVSVLATDSESGEPGDAPNPGNDPAPIAECAHDDYGWDYEGSKCWKVCNDCDETFSVGDHKDGDDDMACDRCGGHVHSMTAYDSDEDYHWAVCEDSSCGEASEAKEAHDWEKDSDESTSTDIVYVCSECGETKSDHTHSWKSTYAYDDERHWQECKSCDEVRNEGVHIDANNSGRCDACKIDMESENLLTELNIDDLDEPADGVEVDFEVFVDPDDVFGTPSVAWNKVISLSKNTSTALTKGKTFEGGKKYNTCISVPMNKGDEIDEEFTVTLNGETVEFYTSKTTVNKVMATYDGKKTVSFAYKDVTSAGYAYIRVCVMYKELPDDHECVYTDEWQDSAAKHWLECTGCGDKEESGYHDDDDDDNKCDVCGFNMKYFDKNATSSSSGSGTATNTHTHAYSADWVEDISNHWKQCTGCGAKTSLAAHADLNNTGLCDVCGFVMTAPAGHTHSFATEWTETFAQHYKVCSCGAKNEIAAHVDLNNTGKCDTCGYAMTTLSNNGIVADTGDNNAVFLWMAALAVSVMGACATVVVARKKREE